jgi:glycosyltransferase involved in cell wall biosynthesis
MRVLIPTNDETFTPSLVAAYLELGWEVTTGATTLYYAASSYDLIHLQWPEELIGWNVPDDRLVTRLSSTLARWRRRAKIISTVHNLLPHRAPEHPLDMRLYRVVYEASDLISHFSHYSYDRVTQKFSNHSGCQHFVHRPFLFSHLLSHQVGRKQARESLAIVDDEFAILVFGTMRSRSELQLVTQATRLADIKRKRMIFAGRPPGGRTCKVLFELWRRTNDVASFQGFIPEGDLPRLLEAADAVIIYRAEPHLNSGILLLALTIGTPVVAPSYGMYAEYLKGSGNELYKQGDSLDLARALHRLAKKPRGTVVAENRVIASNWGWSGTLASCLTEVWPGQRAAQSYIPLLSA